MGELFTPWHLILLPIALGFMALAVLPYWKIFERAGFPPAMSLLMYIPPVNLIILYYVAYSDWKPTRA